MLNIRHIVAIGLCVLLAATISCGDDDTGPTEPVAGTLTLTLDTPHADDGALLLRLEGPDMTQVELAAGTLYLRFLEDQAGLTAVFVGDVTSGDLLTFRVPDVSRVGSYSATMLEAADRTNAMRGSLAEYMLSVEP